MTPEMQSMLDTLEAEAVQVARGMATDERQAMIQAAVEARVAKLRAAFDAAVAALSGERDAALVLAASEEADCAAVEADLLAVRGELATARAEAAVLKSMQTTLSDLASREFPVPAPIEFPEPEPVDLSPVMLRIDALAAAMTPPKLPPVVREIEKITPIRGGPDNLIIDAVIKYKEAI